MLGDHTAHGIEYLEITVIDEDRSEGNGARPGGWIELVEPPIGVRGAGPAIERLLSLTLAGAAARGLDTTSKVFDSLDGHVARLSKVTETTPRPRLRSMRSTALQ